MQPGQTFALRGSMIAAKKPSGKFNTEMFDDVPVLQRKWQAALRPGERLPRYEDVMLGSLGRLADHIALLKHDNDTLELSRSGRYIQKWLGDDRWDIPLSALSPDCATALGEAAANALSNGRPHLAIAHSVRDGLVQTYDVLALPTSSRWGGTLIGPYINERAAPWLRWTIWKSKMRLAESRMAASDSTPSSVEEKIVSSKLYWEPRSLT